MRFGLALILAWTGSTAALNSITEIEGAVAAREVTSVDQLWRRLPFEMLAPPVVIYRGLGPAPTTARRPRLVVANADGNLFAAVATDPKHWSYDRLDLASADAETGELSLHLVDFTRDRVITRNPRECMGCHMVNGTVRLRVEPYPHWPGWFGHHDRLEEESGLRFSTSEARAMTQFLRAQRHLPRLIWPYVDAFHMIEPMHNAATRLTTLAVRAEARAAFHRLRGSSIYDRVKLALASPDAEQFASALDEDLRADFAAGQTALDFELRQNVVRYSNIMNEAFRRTNGGRWRVNVPALEYKSLIPFEWAFRKAGLTLASYSTSVAPGALNINTGVGDLVDYLRQFISDDLAAAYGLGDDHVVYASVFEAMTLLPVPRAYRDDFVPAVRARMCRESLKSSTASDPRSAPPAPSP